MKKVILFVLLLLIVPGIAGASFDVNLYYGLKNNNDVKELQQFLTDQKVYSGPVTGNFLSMTLQAVKNFQTKNSITPVYGYFGPKTRAKANSLLAVNLPKPTSSTEKVVDNTVYNDLIKAIEEKLASINQLMEVAPASIVSVVDKDFCKKIPKSTYVTVLSPRRYDVWEKGKTYKIEYASRCAENATIVLRDSLNIGELLTPEAVSIEPDQTYTFEYAFPLEKQIMGHYKIFFYNTDGMQVGESDQFDVVEKK